MFNFGNLIQNIHQRKGDGMLVVLDMEKEKNQAYVMDLFWNPDLKVWKDNRRLDVYSS